MDGADAVEQSGGFAGVPLLLRRGQGGFQPAQFTAARLAPVLITP
jgi:hypothetical protein